MSKTQGYMYTCKLFLKVMYPYAKLDGQNVNSFWNLKVADFQIETKRNLCHEWKTNYMLS